MNLLEVRSKLVDYFLKTPVLDESQFLKIELSGEVEEVRNSLFREALKDLEENKFVRGLTKDGSSLKTHWVLETPHGFRGQQIEIGLATASFVSKLINQYRKANNVKDDFCDILSIDEKDINNLCLILAKTLNEEKA